VIAITGSLGETTTKECLASALQAYGNTLKTLNNHNDQCGVPHSIRAMRP
jgi:UDP-N-acetylmuramoyl-tripeptide--D-alanyl-D-alanine ligase